MGLPVLRPHHTPETRIGLSNFEHFFQKSRILLHVQQHRELVAELLHQGIQEFLLPEIIKIINSGHVLLVYS